MAAVVAPSYGRYSPLAADHATGPQVAFHDPAALPDAAALPKPMVRPAPSLPPDAVHQAHQVIGAGAGHNAVDVDQQHQLQHQQQHQQQVRVHDGSGQDSRQATPPAARVDSVAAPAAEAPQQISVTGGALVAGEALKERNKAIALRAQLSSQARELAQCRHALDVACAAKGTDQFGNPADGLNTSSQQYAAPLTRPRVIVGSAGGLADVPLRSWVPATAQHDQSGAVVAESHEAVTTMQALEVELDRHVTAERAAIEKATAAESQVEELTVQLAEKDRRIAELEHQKGTATAVGGPTVAAAAAGPPGGASSAAVAHLMAQIQFLHQEVERLESALAQSRQTAAADAAAAAATTAETAAVGDDVTSKLQQELARLRARQITHGSASANHEATTLRREVQTLGNALDEARADRTAALEQKHEALQRNRKLEQAFKSSQQLLKDSESSLSAKISERDAAASNAQETLVIVAKERDHLQRVLDDRRIADAAMESPPRQFTTAVQCEPETPPAQISTQTDASPMTVAASCQVGSGTGTAGAFVGAGFDDGFGADDAIGVMSVAQLQGALEAKCAELDAARAQLDTAEERMMRANSRAEQALAAHQDESARRTQIESEAERTAQQCRALQQQAAQLQVMLRDRDTHVAAADDKAEQSHQARLRLEEERAVWEQQLANSAHDVRQLVSQQAAATGHAAQAAEENETLREEVQKLLQREAQLDYALRAKDSELQDILQSYQQCVQENENQSRNLGAAERECDNLRTLAQQGEERAQQQLLAIQELGQREQQMAMDLQAMDHENGLLHRRLMQAEHAQRQIEQGKSEVTKAFESQRQVSTELDRVQADLLKQIALKDNETMLLRQRCDQIEREFNAVSTAHDAEANRRRELEDHNARLVVKGVMAGVQQEQSRFLSDEATGECRAKEEAWTNERDDLKRRLDEALEATDKAAAAARDAERACSALRFELAGVQAQRDELCERMQRLVQRQQTAFAEAERSLGDSPTRHVAPQ